MASNYALEGKTFLPDAPPRTTGAGAVQKVYEGKTPNTATPPRVTPKKKK